jgi:hypothetical protein
LDIGSDKFALLKHLRTGNPVFPANEKAAVKIFALHPMHRILP